MSGSLHQNPEVPLLQNVFVRISASAASMATCASGSLRQDPVVGPLAQDQCMRISCARYLCRDVCNSVSGFCRIFCARSLYEDLLHKAKCLEHLCKIGVYEDLLCKMSVSTSPL